MDIELVHTQRKKVSVCVGMIFRYSENEFINSNGDFVYTERMRLQRRLSCKGCEKCDWLHDCYKEQGVVWPKGLVKGELYSLQITNESRDWESGYIDDFDLEFVRVPTEEV